MIEEDRLISPQLDGREEQLDRAVRPSRLSEYIGQSAVKEQMEIFISAARNRQEPLDHTLVLALPVLARRHWQISLLRKWGAVENNLRSGTGKSWRLGRHAY